MPRLPKGLFRRGNSYYVRERVGYRDVWQSLGPDRDKASRAFRTLRSGERVSDSRTRVEEAAKVWVDTYVATRRNAKGAALTETRLDRYLKVFMGPKVLSRVTRQDFREYRLWLERGALSPQSVVHVLSDARCLFNWAVDTGLLEASPFPRRVMPRVQERPPDRLSDDEVERLLRVPEPYGFIVRLLLGTGLRWGELIRARAEDLDNGCLVISQTKSGRMRRVPLGSDLLSEVRRRIGRLAHYGPKSSGAFATRIQKLSGIERFHAHQLRHTFACRWIERGGSLAALQQILGHSTVVTTQRYARISDDLVRREVERLQAGGG